ncbi:heavy-metal-associated domain-containing protein, partial [Klebsiella pneumoniae]
WGHFLLELDGIKHARKAQTVEAKLSELSGVLEVQVSATGQVHIDFDKSKIKEADILEALKELNVTPVRSKAANPSAP